MAAWPGCWRQALLLVAGFWLFAGCSAAILNIDARILSKNVSSTLDALLDKRHYDKRIRPNYGGSPVTITVNLLVKSMGSVTETDESYTMDIYFRQVWYDSRLKFSPLPGRGELSLPWLFMGLVWKPDTYFMNGKRSHLHRITVPNTFLRLRHDGYLTYSMRLTVKARCPMNLRKFPLDSQRCPLLISSYGYGVDDVLYRWNSSSSDDNVNIEPSLEIAQFDLINVSTVDHQVVKRGHSGSDGYSVIKAVFQLKRHTGFFMLQMYVPCVLIVCCSWVSFWIDPQDAPGRVGLGVMNALSLTTLGVGGKAQMPKVPYPTAIDWFVILCNCFVFAVMVEYASINLSDKVTKDLKKLILDRLGTKSSPPKNGQGLDAPTERQKSASMVNLPVPGSARDEVDDDPAPLSASAVELSPSTPATRQGDEEGYGRIRRSGELPPEDLDQEAEVISPIIRVSGKPLEQQEEEVSSDRPPSTTQMVIPRIQITRGASCDQGDDGDEGISLEDEGDPRSMGTPEAGTAPPPDTLGVISRSTRGSVRRSLMRPVRAWRSYRFLPREEDVTRQLESQEEPSKFSAMDINSRKVFPISFLILQTGYWVGYLYYIDD